MWEKVGTEILGRVLHCVQDDGVWWSLFADPHSYFLRFQLLITNF
jgi:hypothetical protein